MSMGERIFQLRKAAGLSQEQLAECLAVSRQAVSKWETDQSVPETEKLAALCRVFGVSADQLLGLEPQEPPKEGEKRVEDIVRQNFFRRCFTAGWITAAVSALALVLELLSLWWIRFAYIEAAVENGMGFYTDVLKYAQMMPMPVVFAVTVLAAGGGTALAVYGAWGARRTKTK